MRGGTRYGAPSTLSVGDFVPAGRVCILRESQRRGPDSPLDSHTGGCKDGSKSKCGKGDADNCEPQDPAVDADDLGYCQKISNGAAVADKECYMGKGYDENDCDSWGANWHWCEKSEPIDPCEGSCYTGGKKNGGYFEDVSYCRRKSSMQC